MGIQFTLLQKLEDLDFADDMVLLCQKITLMRQKFVAQVEQAVGSVSRLAHPKPRGSEFNCVGEVLE